MPTVQLNNLVRHIHRIALGHDCGGMTDGELVKRFVAHRDEAAFEALVRRHGPLVLGVCRRVLHHRQDAEDAFQATFLVLLHKAGSIAQPELVGNWLYGVAYHTAKNAETSAARRRARERQVSEMPQARPVAEEEAWRELRPLLDEELSRLPDKYRVPVVLCELRGRSRKEVARHLGCPEGTVSSRLARARQLLRKRLAKRGLALSAGSLAVALSQDVSASVPAPLVVSTVKTVMLVAASPAPTAGVVSAQVAALTEGVLKTMFLAKLKIVTALVLVAGIVATGAAMLTHQPAAAKPADDPTKAAPRPSARQAGAEEKAGHAGQASARDATEPVVINGRVLGTDGKPFTRAKLFLCYYNLEEKAMQEVAKPVRATSGSDGRFQLTIAKSELAKSATEYGNTAVVLAMADDHGADWSWIAKGGEMTLRLVKDVPIHGRILTVDGQPVAGAKIRLEDISTYANDDLTAFIRSVREGEFAPAGGKGWQGPFPGQPKSLTTDNSGRFRLDGIGRERVIRLHVEGPAIQYKTITVITRVTDKPVEPTVKQRTNAPALYTAYGARFDYLAPPSRPIRGVVRDKVTGKRVAGVKISADFTLTTQSDKEGRYELLGHAKSPQYHLDVQPAAGQPYFAAAIEFSDPSGLDPVTQDIELVRGIPFRGRLTDKQTGQPIAGARVDYNPLFPNTYIVRLVPHAANPCSSTTTQADGTFSLPVLPGPGAVGFEAYRKGEPYMPAAVTKKELAALFNGVENRNNENFLSVAMSPNSMGLMSVPNYNALALINPAEALDALKYDVTLEVGRTLAGTVVGPDSKPISGVMIIGLTEHRFASETLKTATFTVRELNPRRTRVLYCRHKEKGLGAVMEIRGDQAKPVTIRLERLGTVTGRIVDMAGQPVAGIIGDVDREGLIGEGNRVTTDRDGRFRIDGVVPGQKFNMRLRHGMYGTPVFNVICIKAGENKDLGEAKIDLND